MSFGRLGFNRMMASIAAVIAATPLIGGAQAMYGPSLHQKLGLSPQIGPQLRAYGRSSAPMSSNKFVPHQGKREIARRLRQMNKGLL